MAVNKTSLSAGAIMQAILSESVEVASHVTKIVPVMTDISELPYIRYRRTKLEQVPQKSGVPVSDMVQIEVFCHTERYDEGIELAEAVREALEFTRAEHDGICMRACYLSDSEELFENDAFVQRLVFNVKI